MSLIKSYLHQKMTNLQLLEEELYDLCRRDPDLLATLCSAYLKRCDKEELEQIEELVNSQYRVSD